MWDVEREKMRGSGDRRLSRNKYLQVLRTETDSLTERERNVATWLKRGSNESVRHREMKKRGGKQAEALL